MSLLKEFSKDTIIYGIGAGLDKVIAIILMPVFVRVLSSEDYGVMGLINTYVGLTVIILSLGMQGAVGRYFFIPKNEHDKGVIVFTSLVIRMVPILSFTILVILFSSKISQLLFNDSQYAIVIMIMAITIPFTTITDLQSVLYRYYRKPVAFVIISLVKALVYFAFGLVLVYVFNYGLVGAVLTKLVSITILSIITYFHLARKIYVFKFDISWARQMLIYGFPLIWAGLASWIYSASDRTILLKYDTLSSIGYYTIAQTFAQPVFIINLAVDMSLTVILMSTYESEISETKEKTKKLSETSWYLYILVAILIVSVLSIFSRELLGFITTSEYLVSAPCITLIAYAFIFSQSAGMTGNGMAIMKKTKPYFWIMLITAICSLGMNLILIPYLGFIGAGISNLLSNVILWAISYYTSQKYFYIKRKLLNVVLVIVITLAINLFISYGESVSLFILSVWYKFLAFALICITLWASRLFNFKSIIYNFKDRIAK